jgi:hypothetical protein
VPWDDAAKAAVLRFWTDQGAILPEAEVQPEQLVEQRRLRSKILWWAASHPRHSDLQVLTAYMTRAHDAAAACGWTEAPWQIALLRHCVISRNESPASILHRVQAIEEELRDHGVCLTPARSLMLAGGLSKTIAAKAVRVLLAALGDMPFSLDVPKVIAKAPQLLNLDCTGGVLQRRAAAMQQLHPQLDVGRMLDAQHGLLGMSDEALAAHWASLQMATALGDDDMRALVQSCPRVLTHCQGVIGWKSQQLRAYDLAGDRPGQAPTPAASMAKVLTSAPYRVWRLYYLVAAAKCNLSAYTWARMAEDRFTVLNPGYGLWLSSHPI